MEKGTIRPMNRPKLRPTDYHKRAERGLIVKLACYIIGLVIASLLFGGCATASGDLLSEGRVSVLQEKIDDLERKQYRLRKRQERAIFRGECRTASRAGKTCTTDLDCETKNEGMY